MATNAEIHTLAAPYALHALSGADVELFERHLADCPACRDEVDEIRETAARLGTAVAVSTPDRMKEAVLNRVRQTRPLPPVEEAGDDDRRALLAAARRRAWRRWWAPVATGVAAAMTAAVIALGVQLGQTRDDLDQAEQISAGISELVSAADAEVVRAEADGAAGTVLVSRARSAVVVHIDGLEPAPAEHTYQLWFIGDDGARSAGVLGAADSGRLGPLTAHGLDDAAQLGVTVEPAGGSEQPTTEPVMVMELPS